MISLDTKAITNELMALTALRRSIATSQRPALTTDQLPGLRIIMRMTFGELMLSLIPWIDECDFDPTDPEPVNPYDDDCQLNLSLTCRDENQIPVGKRLAIKRTLEHLVAISTMAWVVTDDDPEFASHLRSQRQAALSALIDDIAANSLTNTASGTSSSSSLRIRPYL